MTTAVKRSGMARHEALEGYLFLLPWLLGFIFFSLGPILASFGIAMTNWRVGLPIKFIGFG